MSEVLPGIRARRKAAGLTIEALAKELGVSLQAVGAWECGVALPSAARLPEIAAVLGCSIDDLFTQKNFNTQEDQTP